MNIILEKKNTIFHLKKISDSELIYIDATFLTAKNYYQLLNILVKDMQYGKNIPHMSEISKDLNIEINMNKKKLV